MIGIFMSFSVSLYTTELCDLPSDLGVRVELQEDQLTGMVFVSFKYYILSN